MYELDGIWWRTVGCVKLLSKKVWFSYLQQQHVLFWTHCCSK